MEELTEDVGGEPAVKMADWVGLFETVSRALCRHSDGCDFIVYPARGDRPRIREPEARHVMTLSLRERGIRYGIEVPTKGKYQISGNKPDTANIDLVIDPDNKHIGVEFKCGQPSLSSILKDVKKFKGEDFGGTAFFHILQNSDSGSLPSLLQKYNSAFEASRQFPERGSKELLLWVLVKERKKAYRRLFGSMAEIETATLSLNDFHCLDV